MQIMVILRKSFSLFHTYFGGKEQRTLSSLKSVLFQNSYPGIINIMYIEKTPNRTSNISTFQGFRGCIIQTLKTTKTLKNHKNKKPEFIYEKILVLQPTGVYTF